MGRAVIGLGFGLLRIENVSFCLFLAILHYSTVFGYFRGLMARVT